jgi:hypothetical protein
MIARCSLLACALAFCCTPPSNVAAEEDYPQGPDIYFILPDEFHGEIRIEQGVADASDPPLEDGHYTIRIPSTGVVRIKSTELFAPWHKERAFLSNGGELPVLSGHGEQPDVIALRSLGMFDDASNNLPAYTHVYLLGTWRDVEDLLNRYHENFKKVTPEPQTSNHSMKPTAPLRNASSVFAATPCRGLSLSH